MTRAYCHYIFHSHASLPFMAWFVYLRHYKTITLLTYMRHVARFFFIPKKIIICSSHHSSFNLYLSFFSLSLSFPLPLGFSISSPFPLYSSHLPHTSIPLSSLLCHFIWFLLCYFKLSKMYVFFSLSGIRISFPFFERILSQKSGKTLIMGFIIIFLPRNFPSFQ